MGENNLVLYRHIRLDTNKVFYIGIGQKSRANNKSNRNNYWKNINNKAGTEVQILKSNLNIEDAKYFEKMLISYYGKLCNKTGILCNISDGGESAYGAVRSCETKLRISLSKTGIPQSEETKIKIGNANRGRITSDEVKMKLSLSNKRTRKIVNMNTGEIYESVSVASIKLNISKSLIYHYLLGECKNKANIKYE